MKKLICFLTFTLGILGCSSDGDTITNSFEKIDAYTTQSLTDISFSNKNQGIICGSFGFLAKTNTGGKTWSVLNVGDKQTFMSAFMVNEQKFYTARLDMFVTTNSGTTFNKIESVSGASTIFDIKFFNPSKGLLVRAGSILKSNDSGNTWTKKYDGYTVDNLVITSDLVAYAYGGYTNNSVDNGIIVKTLDGGETWTQTLTSDSDITSLSFISDNIGYYINFKRELYKTSNGSTSWTKIANLPGSGSPTSICFTSENIGYFSTDEGKIFETKNGGLNWKIVYNKTTDLIWKIIAKDGAVYAIGNNGLFLKKK
ncbi:YCF48-related protein [Flavobacterium sp. LHD-80]|uniref:WD40/YVTN/BNR-like repeat-containing protein n=1 Tax=Flavobacterium sp. LHD-80 TaxID=3071411 RepID=UPI0027E0C467|nr:YCF48-related protein [Flavobacterium sp. LHD-80]MDQ6470297.1 YCF48-related protein [Flavobacterium sp. LHD-80]